MAQELHTRGRFVWHDLVSYDRAKSVPFFTKLIGWTTREEDVAEYVHAAPGVGNFDEPYGENGSDWPGNWGSSCCGCPSGHPS